MLGAIRRAFVSIHLIISFGRNATGRHQLLGYQEKRALHATDIMDHLTCPFKKVSRNSKTQGRSGAILIASNKA
jgi:hypothetical protein